MDWANEQIRDAMTEVKCFNWGRGQWTRGCVYEHLVRRPLHRHFARIVTCCYLAEALLLLLLLSNQFTPRNVFCGSLTFRSHFPLKMRSTAALRAPQFLLFAYLHTLAHTHTHIHLCIIPPRVSCRCFRTLTDIGGLAWTDTVRLAF